MDDIINNIIKNIQKFVNAGFYYSNWSDFEDKQIKLLLNPPVAEKIEKNKYNAIIDTIYWFDNHVCFVKNGNYIITSKISVNKLYQYNLKIRSV